jgi:hypothetical protein
MDRHDCNVGGQIDGAWEAAKAAQSALDDPHELMPESPKRPSRPNRPFFSNLDVG